MSRGIDFSKLQEEPEEPRGPVRHIAHIGQGMSVQEFLEHANYPFYGLLLPSAGESKLNDYVRASWDEVHLMSGTACMLVTTLVPAEPTKEQRAFLTSLVGDEARADQAWQEYSYSPQQIAKDVYTLAQQSQIGYDTLPCLVLMADLNSNQRVILRLPDWEAERLRHFFEAVFTKLNTHMREPDAQQRYQSLKKELGLGFQMKQHVGNVAHGIQETVTKVDWSEVIQSTLTNKELMAGAMKLLLGALGVPAA